MQTDNDTQTLDLPSPPCNRAAGFKRTWEYDVPDISTTGLEDKQLPVMPNLESALGNSLQSVRRTGKHLLLTRDAHGFMANKMTSQM